MGIRDCVLGGVLLTTLAVPPQQSFSSGTLGVRVDVRVTERGRPVAGLKVPEFEPRDNGGPPPLAVAEPSDVPVNAVLALDVSDSTAGKRLADLTSAGRRVVA